MLVRWLLLILVIGLVAAVAVVWIPPALAGPVVDCGDIERTTCAELLPEVVANAQDASGLVGLLMPMTRVSLSGDALCLSWEVWYLFGFGLVSNSSC